MFGVDKLPWTLVALLELSSDLVKPMKASTFFGLLTKGKFNQMKDHG